MAKITLIGMFNYLNNQTPPADLFEGVKVPDAIDKDILVMNILKEGGEFETLYASPPFMQGMIAHFFNVHSRTFTKWADALALKYEPIENYDRYEDITIADTRSDSNTIHSEGTGSSDASSSSTNTDKLTSSTEHDVSAYDSSALQLDTKDATTSTDTVTTSSSSKGSQTQSDDSTSTASGKSDRKHTAHIHGNTGVTTSQQMLQSELDISKWNIYSHITDLFIEELTVPVYT